MADEEERYIIPGFHQHKDTTNGDGDPLGAFDTSEANETLHNNKYAIVKFPSYKKYWDGNTIDMNGGKGVVVLPENPPRSGMTAVWFWKAIEEEEQHKMPGVKWTPYIGLSEAVVRILEANKLEPPETGDPKGFNGTMGCCEKGEWRIPTSLVRVVINGR